MKSIPCVEFTRLEAVALNNDYSVIPQVPRGRVYLYLRGKGKHGSDAWFEMPLIRDYFGDDRYVPLIVTSCDYDGWAKKAFAHLKELLRGAGYIREEDTE